MKQTTLYRYFDYDGKLLYVGISYNPLHRLKQHEMNAADWLKDIATATFTHYGSRDDAVLAEKQAILLENPLWNFVHNPNAAPRTKRTRKLGNFKEVQPEKLVWMPNEPCIVIDGMFVSVTTGKDVKGHFSRCVFPSWVTPDENLVAEWMEYFGYEFRNGEVRSNDGQFSCTWSTAICMVQDDWKEVFVEPILFE